MTDGEFGELPDWYITLRAARALGVPPWELIDKPMIWQQWALTAEAAENSAKREHERQAERRRNRKTK